MKTAPALPLCAVALLAATAHGAWDPLNADWGKSDETDLRVMTWNIQDGICSSNDKLDNSGDWNGLVRIVAALQPDVLILQECGDNGGNGTGSGLDSTTTLANVLELFFHGGSDPYLGGSVTSYVQLFVPAYDLPHVYVSTSSDGFNRNIILSRYPFVDLNGGGALNNDFLLAADAYQGGGNGGIRGFMTAEIDLPDEIYAGDVVIGNAHLRSGSAASDFDERRVAAENTAYFIDYYYNGAGTGVSDPNSKVLRPTSGVVLDADTPVIWGGDFNQVPSATAPAQLMIQAEFLGGTDGTDRDRTDSTRDFAIQPVSGESSTQSSSKLDYICWQDSIATARRSFVFRSIGSGMTAAQLPFPVDGFPGNPQSSSGLASDHRPVIVDFILPAAEPGCPAPPDYLDDDTLNFFDIQAYVALFNSQDPSADLAEPFGTFNFFDISAFVGLFTTGCP